MQWRFMCKVLLAKPFERSEEIKIIMNDSYQTKRNVTVADAIKDLGEKGVEVTEKQAAEILDLMYFLASLIVKQNFSDDSINNRPNQ